VDVIALARPEGQLIQCKTSTMDGAKLSWDAVKDVVAGEAAYRQRYPDVLFSKACVTNQFFNETTRRHAESNQVTLFDQNALVNLLNKHPLTKLDIDRIRYVEWGQTA
jgi:hypothetical protein